MTLFLWDASDFDWSRGPMDLRAAAADGIVGFTHKATEATWIQHVHTGEALARARDAGIEFVGAYHVVRSTDVHAQVAYYLAYLDAVAAWWRSFPGFFHQVDLELWSYDRVTAATGKAFAEALAAAQPQRVVMYASRGQYGDQLATLSPAIPLWNAAYGTNPIAHYPDAYRGDGSANWAPYSGRVPVFWQYGSQLRIGTQPDCDCNAFRGSVDDLRALIEGGSMTISDQDAQYLIWRVETLMHNRPAAIGGPAIGEVNETHNKLEALTADHAALSAKVDQVLAALAALPGGGVDQAAVEAAAERGAKAGIDGSTIHTAP